MTDDCPPHPSVSELLERIASLEKRLQDLDSAFRRACVASCDVDKMIIHHCKSHDDEFRDAWARIKNLEFTVFPKLARDLDNLHNIVGDGEPDRANQLDSREKLPWKDDGKKPKDEKPQ